MSAAATAAGYLYASGRLRGKSKEGEHGESPGGPREGKRHDERGPDAKAEGRGAPRRRPLRVAVLREPEHFEPQPAPAQPRTVKVAYRTRRWRPDAD